MKLGKPSMNHKNDLDECWYILNFFLNFPNFRILYSKLPNLLSYFDYLLGKKVPKLLESWYPSSVRYAMAIHFVLLILVSEF